MLQKFSVLVPVDLTPCFFVGGTRVVISLLVCVKHGRIVACVSSVGDVVKQAQLRLSVTAISQSKVNGCPLCVQNLFSSAALVIGDSAPPKFTPVDEWYVRARRSSLRARKSLCIDSRWRLMFLYFLYDLPLDCYLYWQELNSLGVVELRTALLSALAKYEGWLQRGQHEVRDPK
jgi:hypothetical protein